MKWNKKITDEFLNSNPTGTVKEFASYVSERKEKKYPRMYYAGSPVPEVGDIIFQEFKNGPKTKLPVCTNQDLVPGQLIVLYTKERSWDSLIKDDSNLLLFQLHYGVSVFKNKTTNNFLVVFNSTAPFDIDPTIPLWVYTH